MRRYYNWENSILNFKVCYLTSRYVNPWTEGVNQASVRIIDSANRAGFENKVISFETIKSKKVNSHITTINTLFNDQIPKSLQRMAYNLNLEEIGSLYFLPFLPNYDIVHILPPLPTIVFSAILRFINNVKSRNTKIIPHLFHPFHPVMDEFMWGEGLTAQTFWRQKLWLLKQGAFDHVFCINQYLKKYVEKFVDKDVVHYVPYPVDTEKFKPIKNKDLARKELGLPIDKFIIGYLGQVYPKRGIFTLLKAFNNISEKLPEILLVIVTKWLDPQKPHVQFFLDYLNKMESKEKVIVLNRILEKVELFYQAVDIMVLPFTQPYYIIDPPLVLMETLASGIPIITTPVGAIKELTDNRCNVILVPPEDPSSISEEIMNLQFDSKLRLKLGKNARNEAMKYSFDAIGAHLKDVYSQIVN